VADKMNSLEILKSTLEPGQLVEILNTVSEGIVICDEGGDILWANEKFLRMHEYKESEVRALNIEKLQMEDKLNPRQWKVVDAVKRGRDVTLREVWHQKWSGEVFPVLLNGRYCRPDAGRPGRVLLSLWDISERKLAEGLLESYEAKVRLLNRLNRTFLLAKDRIPYEEVLYTLRRYFNCDGAAFFSGNRSGILTLQALQTRQKYRLGNTRRSLDLNRRAGELTRIWRDRATGYVNGAPELGDYEKRLGIENVLATVLNFKTRIDGFVVLFNRPGGFREADSGDLEIVGNQLTPLFKTMLQRDRLQRRRKKARDKLESALREKEVLIKEIHHRVKNNLNMVYSLLHFQKKHIGPHNYGEVVETIQNRIKSIALIHEHLYTSPNLNQVNCREYLIHLAREILKSLGLVEKEELLSVSIDRRIFLNLATIHCLGLIVHELVSNAVKHGFRTRKSSPRIFLGLKRGKEEGYYTLAVADNGRGMDPGAFHQPRPSSMGTFLVKTLTENLQGTLSVKTNKGTEVRIDFREIPD